METAVVHGWPRPAVKTAVAWSAMEAARARPAVMTSKSADRNGRDANRYYEFLVHFCLLS
jgi:hypothetical protein